MAIIELRVIISSGRLSLAAFASLRLGENRRLNKEAHRSQRRRGGRITLLMNQWWTLWASHHYFVFSRNARL